MHRRIALILFAIFALPSLSASAAISTAPVITTAWGISDMYHKIATAAMNAISPTDYPVRVEIPSVNIDSAVQSLGTNAKGEMDVPSGKSTNVGWYKYGTVPGMVGSAVFDAHVFAAFQNLKDLAPGSDVYVVMASGMRLHFVVSDTATYALATLTPNMLFGLRDDKRLNLITCAGSLTPDRSTYDHRLIVYTTFAGIDQA